MEEHTIDVFKSVFKFEDNKSYLLIENLEPNTFDFSNKNVSNLVVEVTTQNNHDKHSYIVVECTKDDACSIIGEIISTNNKSTAPTFYFVSNMTLYSYVRTDTEITLKPIHTKTSEDDDWFFKTLFLKKRVSMFSYNKIDGLLTYSI